MELWKEMIQVLGKTMTKHRYSPFEKVRILVYYFLFKSSVIAMFFSFKIFNLCVSHCCLIDVDEAHRIVFQILSAVELGFGFLPPPKKKWQQQFVMKLEKTWDVSTCSEIKPTWSDFFQLKISHNWRYTAVHMSKCWSTCVVVMWFFGHPHGERMPYTVTQAALVTGSCGSGKTAGVRKLRT